MLSLISLFLLTAVCYFISQKLMHKFLPKVSYYIPFSILFGVLLLVVQKWFNNIEAYTSLTNYMLAVIFALVPLSMQNLKERNFTPIKRLWLYSVLQHFSQWGLIGLIVLLVLAPLLQVSDIFVSLIPGGYAGGYGSAALMGELFEKFSHPEMRTLLMSTATVGMALSIVGGVFWLAKFKGEGLTLDLDEQGVKLSFKKALRPLLYLFLVIFLGHYVSILITLWFKVTIPTFAGAFIASFLVSRFKSKALPDHNESAFYSDKATDLLVIFGIASIQIEILQESLVALSILWGIGLINAIIMLRVISPRVFGKVWREQGLFAWGWSLGGIMMGFALLKGANSKDYAKNLQDYSLAYMLVSPIEICGYMFMPWLLTSGQGLPAVLVVAALASIILFQLFRKTD